MNFSPAFLDEIRARLPVSEVAGQRVKLKKQGREWRGLSPFGAEKTPSFYVNDQKGFYHDFSSGKHGDIFSFLRETEGLSFPESVERLAQMAGVPMPVQSQENREADKARAGLTEVLDLAASFFQGCLQAREGARARGYLADRGMSAAMQQHFRIGYGPPDKYAMRDALALKGATVETMVEAGLLIHGEDIAVPYDRFRDRVMFPICDRGGRVIAFGGRALDKNAAAKYLNSPETPLFHKGSVLYNHHNARKAAHDTGTVIAVEGYVDVVSMTAAGFAHVVAPLGTALTADQCGLLWKMTPEPILCFDGDKAGRKAAYRAIDTALPLLGPEKTLRFALLPDGQDPDDLARAGGAEAVRAVIAQARPLVDVLWQRETQDHPLATPEQRAGLERRLREVVKTIADETLKQHYLDDINARLSKLFGRDQRRERSWQGRQGGAPGRPPPPGRRGFGKPNLLLGEAGVAPVIGSSLARSALFARGPVTASPREAMILILLVNHPGLLAQHAEDIAGLELAGREHDALRNALVALSGEDFEDHVALIKALDNAGVGEIRRKLEAVAAISSLWCVSPAAAQPDADEALRQALTLHRKTHALHQGLRQSQRALGEGTLDDDAAERELAHLRDIQSQLAAIEGTEAMVEGFGVQSGRSAADL